MILSQNLFYQSHLSRLPSTLPPPQSLVKEEETMVQDPDEKIKQQQFQIEELKKAIERSNQQLLSQNIVLKYEVSDPRQDI